VRPEGLWMTGRWREPPPKEDLPPAARDQIVQVTRYDVGDGTAVRAVRERDRTLRQLVSEYLDAPGPERFRAPQAAPVVLEPRLIHWCKVTDPRAAVPVRPPAVDLRVILPLAPEFTGLRARLSAAGVAHREVRYLLEEETVSTTDDRGGRVPLRATARLDTGTTTSGTMTVTDLRALAARDAFELLWDGALRPEVTEEHVDAAGLVSEEWLPYLPYPTLNPLQRQALPVLLEDRAHVVVTAPTGSGKTMIGMFAVLKAILGQGRKAVWVVPQRSLTDELEQELAAWRAHGLRVQRLSGEYVTDTASARQADLWVATTEKFEAICRAGSLRDTLAEVDVLVVDEIHLLGDPGRGPLLEAMLSRMRGADSPVRIVGLSATAANAGQVAEWLGGRLVTTTWRPTSLTWQLPMVSVNEQRRSREAHRTRVATAITQQATNDSGSVLVFCGNKRGVRATALAIAKARGADIRGIDPDDLARVHQICKTRRIGLHYKDWEHKREAERAFRARELDVLVATSTLAAGVNLPARTVIVRDTEIGVNSIDVATVLQMFGRAGRIGMGETEGWAYLITDENERPLWQSRLAAGYTITSRIADDLADHVLAEIAQERIVSLPDAERWWQCTLAHHQGNGDLTAVHSAVTSLVDGGYLRRSGPDLTITALGTLTTRVMVPVTVGTDLRTALAISPTPADPDTAEHILAHAIATQVPQLAQAPTVDEVRPQILRLLQARGRPDRLPDLTGDPDTDLLPGDLAQVAFALVANSPHLFTRPYRVIAGVPAAGLYTILEDSTRYFGWLAAQGILGTVHPWIAVVAGDLGRRVRWRRLGPSRGSGRLLWICEQMATPLHANTDVPDLFTAARNRDITAPDWPVGRPPRQCRLEASAYRTLLADRATGTSFAPERDGVTITCPPTATATVWRNAAYHIVPDPSERMTPYPAASDATADSHGATVFSRRGDHLSSGWLATYNSTQDSS